MARKKRCCLQERATFQRMSLLRSNGGLELTHACEDKEGPANGKKRLVAPNSPRLA